MRNKLDSSKELEIRDLYRQGYSIKSISEKLSLPYHATYARTRILERGFYSIGSYEKEQEEKRKSDSKHNESKNFVIDILSQLHITETDLAKYLGITKQAVSNYVYGKTIPRREIRERINYLLIEKGLEGLVN